MKSCPVCGNKNNIQILKLEEIPTNTNTLLPDKNTAINAPLGEINLQYCKECSHIFNSSFNSKKITYGLGYENCLLYSPIFKEYIDKQISRIISKYTLKNKTILEIGCGNGEFLELICKKADANGIGYDPCSIKTTSNDGRIKYYKKEFKKKYIKQKPQLIISRQTLEHISNPKEFLNDIRELILESKGRIFFEVPNGLNLIKEDKIWDFIYEHFSYFTPDSLKILFNKCGFKVVKIKNEFGNQYLTINAVIGNDLSTKVKNLEKMVKLFSKNSIEKISKFKNQINELKRNEKKAVVWGMGSKGIMFLNLVDKNGFIEYGIDINPNKKGKYIPGIGQKIMNPEFLNKYKPDVIFVMNDIYIDEIKTQLKRLKIFPKLIIV